MTYLIDVSGLSGQCEVLNNSSHPSKFIECSMENAIYMSCGRTQIVELEINENNCHKLLF